MKTGHKKKVTLMLDSDVYHGLQQKVGGRAMGNFLSKIIRPHVVISSLEASYRELSLDEENFQEHKKWETIDPVIVAENTWRL